MAPKDMGKRIASLEDDPTQAALVRQIVTAAGHACTTFTDGQRMLLALRDASFDLLLLDWKVPHVSGRDVLAWVRANLDRRIPVMFLTGRDAEDDVVDGLAGGADDYMIKPIRPRELAARIESLLRRAYPGHAGSGARLCVGAFAFDASARIVTCHGQPVSLTPKEFDLALLLFRNEGRIVSRNHIVAAVWGRDISPLSRTVDTHVSRVRSKLGLHAGHGVRLMPIYTHGYRLERLDGIEASQVPARAGCPLPAASARTLPAAPAQAPAA